MNMVTLLTIVAVTLACGFGLGVLSMLMYEDSDNSRLANDIRQQHEDSIRLSQIEANNWHVGCSKGVWAVLKAVDGEMCVVGKTHRNLRDAIDGAHHG